MPMRIRLVVTSVSAFVNDRRKASRTRTQGGRVPVGTWPTEDAVMRRFAAGQAHNGTRGRGHLARRLPATRLALVGAAEEGTRRPEQNLDVDARRVVLHVPEVELDALGPREPRAAVDLRPAGDPRLD